MVIKAGKYSPEELSKVDVGSVAVISIETTIEKEKIEVIKQLLQVNNDIRIALIVDPAVTENNGKYSNLEVIAALGDIKHLAVLAFGSVPLQDINLLSGLKSLVSFRLDGNYKKDIDLGALRNASGIKDLELEFGLFGADQIKFLSDLAYLRSLRVSVLDLKKVSLNYGLEELTITNTLKNADHLIQVFPRLRKLSINQAKGIDSFNFIASLKDLQALQIGHTNKLTSLPKMEKPQMVRSLHLVNTKQFDDLGSILQFQYLEELKATEPTKIALTEFARIKEIKSLKRIYAVFSTEAEDEAFRQMADDNGWITNF